MDRRTAGRQKRLALAARLAVRLNEATGRQAKYIRRLATEKPRPQWVPDGNGGIRPKGYERSVVTALRPRGQVTLWWHEKSRSYRIKIDSSVKGASERRLLLDAFAKVGSGVVARCPVCGLFFARHDGRQRFCESRCADRDRQRRARTRRRHRRPEARVAFLESNARLAAERQRLADWRAAQPYVSEQIAQARDAQARRAQRRLRNES
jgi:hypothetical protein